MLPKDLLKSVFQSLFFFLLIAVSQFAHAESATKIDGILNASRYNPVLGTPLSNTTVQVSFTATISNGKWSICVTNLDNKAWWGEIFCDGTNIYTLNPEGDLWLDEPPGTDHLFSTVSPAPLYVAPVDDTLGLATIYVTYALSPKLLAPGKNGVIEMPLPWNLGRSSPKGNGFKWEITSDSDFIGSFRIIRDNSLDLSDQDEMLRQEIDFPHKIEDRNSYLASLNYRKTIPNGYTQAEFAVTSTYDTNHTQIPKSSELKYYMYSSSVKHPFVHPIYKSSLKATNLAFLDDYQSEVPPTDVEADVHDYRYKKLVNGQVFNYADYKLHPGETWKAADDAALLQQREHYLKHGARISSFVMRKPVLIFLIIALVAVPLLAVLILKHKSK
jgi:hypothetical protein